MERILVSMDSRRGAWEAWNRAISLAKRINARVYALLVIPPVAVAGNIAAEVEGEASVRRRLELLIELSQSDGVPIDYFVSEGSYEEEVIRFVQHNKISLLVAEPPQGGENRNGDRDASSIQKIRHRINCRMELVTPKKDP